MARLRMVFCGFDSYCFRFDLFPAKIYGMEGHSQFEVTMTLDSLKLM
jgi:hypothetical protein